MDALKEYLKRKLNVTDEQYLKLVEQEKERIGNPSFIYEGDSLNDSQELKKKEMNFRCEKAIINGFASTNGHVYRTNRDDQTNLIGQYNEVIADETVLVVYWKTEDEGYVSHTRNEWLANVYQEGFMHKEKQLFKYDTRKKQIYDCTEISEVAAITW